jgi:hypothetical protein
LKDSEETDNSQVTKDKFSEYLKDILVRETGKLKNFGEAIENLQREVSDYRHVFFGEKDTKEQEKESIKVIEDKLVNLLRSLEDIEKSSDESNKLGEIVNGVDKDKIHEELEELRKKLKELEASDEQLQENAQQLDNQVGTSGNSQHSTTDNKGKDKENKNYVAISIDKPTNSADERTPLNTDFKAQIEVSPKGKD